METYDLKKTFIPFFVILMLFLTTSLFSQSTLDCSLCHKEEHNSWITSKHADTQNDVADELAEEWAGFLPDSVILGSEGENCVACHSPSAVSALGGMTEVEVLSHFFSLTDGKFTDTTKALDTENWPHVACVSCHDVPADHPGTLPTLAIFNSTTVQYDSVRNPSYLCGQCHGTIRFADTDHRLFDGWLLSRHASEGQIDVASELAEEWAGSTPDEVINGPDAENCIACHAPTAVLTEEDMTEAQALDHFFSTSGGVFGEDTAPVDTLHWPGVACTACHDPMHPDTISFFNSTIKDYQIMSSAQELCGQCHGNLRFPDTDHLSYNIEEGTGGMGVPDTLTMPDVECTDCHMYSSPEEGTNSSMYAGHSWSVFTEESDGSVIASCTSCHTGINADKAMTIIENWQSEYAELDSIAQEKVEMADSFLVGSTDTLLLKYLEEAKHNLAFSESDESGGVHNHNYTMSLLNDAVAKSDLILTGINETQPAVARNFELYQNYPNPFNGWTTIAFYIAEPGRYALDIYNVKGQKVKTLIDKKLQKQLYSVRFNANDLSSGIYFYKLSGTGVVKVKKLILIK